MSDIGDRAYFSCRAEEEIQRGEESATMLVAAVHYELAYRYSLKADQSDSRNPSLTLIK